MPHDSTTEASLKQCQVDDLQRQLLETNFCKCHVISFMIMACVDDLGGQGGTPA